MSWTPCLKHRKTYSTSTICDPYEDPADIERVFRGLYDLLYLQQCLKHGATELQTQQNNASLRVLYTLIALQLYSQSKSSVS